jgi:3-hydroxybutyryl-CoA dehydrogenase
LSIPIDGSVNRTALAGKELIGTRPMSERQGYESPGIAGSGAIATGLAAVSTTTADTILLARSEASAWRAEEKVVAACAKIEGAEPSRLRVTTDPKDLADCDIVVEAIVEELDAKAELIKTLDQACPDADLATTTSSLGIGEISGKAGVPRLYGLHVFNPVPRMALVEVCIPDGAQQSRKRAMAWCAALGKTAVEVPDQAGFVVNRLLFPYLFDGVRLMERTGMEAGEVDTCMKLGAGHPMGPLALLDFVGLDVAEAIGDALYADSNDPAHKPPGLIVEMIGEAKLGRKSGAGFYSYD